jgi:retron-type reverse transcriptase
MELLESILSRVNMQRAFKQVMRNKGSGGVDGVEIEGFTTQVEKEWPGIRARIQEGSYEPQAVRRVEIPKPDGGVRLLGIPKLLSYYLVYSFD